MKLILSGFQDEIEKCGNIKARLLEAGAGGGLGVIGGALSANPEQGENRLGKAIKRGLQGAGLGLGGSLIVRAGARKAIKNTLINDARQLKNTLRGIRKTKAKQIAITKKPKPELLDYILSSKTRAASKTRVKAIDKAKKQYPVLMNARAQKIKDYTANKAKNMAKMRKIDDKIFGVF